MSENDSTLFGLELSAVRATQSDTEGDSRRHDKKDETLLINTTESVTPADGGILLHQPQECDFQLTAQATTQSTLLIVCVVYQGADTVCCQQTSCPDLENRHASCDHVVFYWSCMRTQILILKRQSLLFKDMRKRCRQREKKEKEGLNPHPLCH